MKIALVILAKLKEACISGNFDEESMYFAVEIAEEVIKKSLEGNELIQKIPNKNTHKFQLTPPLQPIELKQTPLDRNKTQ